MHLRVTSDTNEESGVGKVVGEISGPTRKHFVPKDYGAGLHGIGVVLMCRDPSLNFKRRLRFSKKDKILYMDVMLDLEQMRHITHQNRKSAIITQLAEDIPAVIRKYSFADFDEAGFTEELNCWLSELVSKK